MYNFLKKEKIINDKTKEKEELIPLIKENETKKQTRQNVWDDINLKEYINNNDDFIKRFKEFCLKLEYDNPRGSYKLFLEAFPNEKLELNYNFYNKKYFNFKRNIEKQIFECFIAFLKTKVANQIYLDELISANLKIEIWNICPIHKEKSVELENINKEVFCTCEII